MRPAIFAFDTETTGLDPLTDEIVSIAMIMLDDQFNEISRKVIYAFADKPVSPEVSAINGYSIEEWTTRGAVSQLVLFAEIYEYVKEHRNLICMGHNVKFDIAFLQELFKRNQSDEFRRVFSYHSLDTVGAAIFFDMVNFGKVGSVHKLEKLCERFGIRLGNAHDALADIQATVDLFKYLYTAMGGESKVADVVPPPEVFSRLLVKKEGVWHLNGGKFKWRAVTELAVEAPDYIQWMLDKVTDLSDEQRDYLKACVGQS